MIAPLDNTTHTSDLTTRGDRAWRVVAEQECRDLWIGGRGPMLLVGFSVLLSIVTYLAATNQILNFLEQREAVNLTLQIAVAVGVLVTLVVSADAVSGERERGTLESLLLSPASRRGIVIGKLASALTLWLATFAVSVPYIWVLARGVAIVGQALLIGLIVGTILAIGMAAIGMLISAASNSNKISLAVSLFLLLALFAPTQLPAMSNSWLGDLLIRINPLASGLHYLTAVLVKGHTWTYDLFYLAAPAVIAIAAGGTLIAAGPAMMRLHARGTSA